MTLEEALETGHETARFCLYSEARTKTVKAVKAAEMLESGKWFRSPEEVAEAARKERKLMEDVKAAGDLMDANPVQPAVKEAPKPPDRAKAIKRAVKSKKKVKK